MRRIETYELIERYLLGRTSPDENAEIESSIKSDPSFANEVEQHRGMQQVINDHAVLDVKEMLTRIRSQKQISIRRRNRFYRSMLIVGSCAIILSLSLLYIFNNNDSAVRPASEAPEASEALADTLTQAGKPETITEDNGPPEDSDQKSEAGKSFTEDHFTDTRTESEKEEPVEDIPKEQEAELIASPDQPARLAGLQSGDDSLAASDLQSNASPDLQSGDDSLAVSDLQSNASPDLQSGVIPPCEIKAEYITEPSCNNKATGVIRIIESTLKTGTPPYQAILNGRYGDSLVFRGLKPGFYRLEIKDASGCLVNLGAIIVDTKDCRYEGNFYPLLEVWEIPLDNQPGTIEIYNKNGLPVYRLRFDGAGPEYWNGNDMNNEALPMGIYFFTISYDSGDDGFQGTVTINR